MVHWILLLYKKKAVRRGFVQMCGGSAVRLPGRLRPALVAAWTSAEPRCRPFAL